MRWQSTHLLEDRLLVVLADPQTMALAGDRERRLEVLAERHVWTGDRREERGLKHGPEPLDANLRVAEDPLEMGVERAQIEQRFVDVEDQNALHEPSAERGGFEPTRLSPTAFRERHLQPLGHLSDASLNFDPPCSASITRGSFRRDLPR